MIRHLIVLGAAALLPGCAGLSPDGRLGEVQALVGERAKAPVTRLDAEPDRREVARAVAERLQRPVDAEGAVALALMNNPGLQAVYAELRIAEADLVQAGRLRNPGFSYGRFKSGDEREIERRIAFDVIGLVTLPWRLESERGLYSAAQLRAAGEVARIADEARRAWVEAVAAQESARYAKQVKEAAEAAAELAREMARAGNFNRLTRDREQLFYAEATANLARSRQAATSARERLARLLGLWGTQLAFRLPERLPDLPAEPRVLAEAESAAVENRLDVRLARHNVEATARAYGLNRATRFVNVLELAYEKETSSEGHRRTGYEIEIAIPIFDWGEARAARAEASYRAAASRLAETAIHARSQVREGYAAYRTAYDLARHYRDEIVPLRKRISEENLLRYNGMLIGVFELLADSREQVAAVMAAIEAARDFWIADANLQTALMTGAPGAAPAMRASPTQAPAAAGGH